mmetsp:Transcript_51526/g.61964  ORF Transcript_51526/g.61964 Transcript_51526/m.61964 type:complete len:88 (+) Transcript_51526:320-583(+)
MHQNGADKKKIKKLRRDTKVLHSICHTHSEMNMGKYNAQIELADAYNTLDSPIDSPRGVADTTGSAMSENVQIKVTNCAQSLQKEIV